MKLLFCAVALSLLEALSQPLHGGVVINEVMANNPSAVRFEGQYTDWVELLNTGPGEADLQGMTLSDDLLAPGKFVFPPGTRLAAGDRLVVWCGGTPSGEPLRASFSFNSAGEAVGLFSPSGAVLDSVIFGLQPPDLSIGRVPDGTGPWLLNDPTPLLDNVSQALGAQQRLMLNEWMAVPASGEDWIELFNPEPLPVALGGLRFSDVTSTPATNRPVRALSFIAAEGFLQFWASDLAKSDTDHLDFKLSNKGETLTLFAENRTTIVNRVVFGKQDTGISQGRLPDGTDAIVPFPVGKATPAASNFLPITQVVINEVLAHTDPPLEDAVELFNPTPFAVDISDWWLSNSKSDARKYRFPPGSILDPGGFLVVYEYQFDPDDSGQGRSFRFNSSRGDTCYLSSGNASGELLGGQVSVRIPPSENGVSWGRYETSSGTKFVPLQGRTFGVDFPVSLDDFRSGTGQPNQPPKVGPAVISEVMYHPSSEVPAQDNTDDEFIEIRNLSPFPLPLYNPLNDLTHPTNTYRIEGSARFDFPLRTLLEGNEAVVLLQFDPEADPDRADSFRIRFGVPAETRLFGPIRGKLGNGGGVIELLKPDEIQRPPHPDVGLIPLILVDRLEYDNQLPWPTEADGGGVSLQRVLLAQFGDEVGNWVGLPPTPGTGIPPRTQPVLSARLKPGHVVELRFVVEAGVAYAVQAADSLESPLWTSLPDQPPVLDSAGEVVVTDEVPAGVPTRYYRILAPAY